MASYKIVHYRDLSIDDLKTNLEEIIDDFININFTLHPKAISETANKKIRHGDVILTYSYSKLVEKVLLDAVQSGKKIKVIVADGRVQNLGRTLANNLVKAGVHTTYILLTAVSQVRKTLFQPITTHIYSSNIFVSTNGYSSSFFNIPLMYP